MDETEFLALFTADEIQVDGEPLRNHWHGWARIWRERLVKLINAAHGLGLDWYAAGGNSHLRAARRDPNNKRSENGTVRILLRCPQAQPTADWVIRDQSESGGTVSLDLTQLDGLDNQKAMNWLKGRGGTIPDARHNGPAYWPKDYTGDTPPPPDGDKPQQGKTMKLNTILFGPPGTGKTHSTVVAALAMTESPGEAAGAFARIQNGELDTTTQDSRKKFRKAFNDKLGAGTIVFTTFHQSYSYEDFIEGVRVTTRGKQAHYEVRNGVFKQLARKALFYKVGQDSDKAEGFEEAAEFYSTRSDEILKCCLSDQTTQARVSSDEERRKAGEIFDKQLRDVVMQLLDPSRLSRFGIVDDTEDSAQTSSESPAVKPPKRFVLIVDEINRGNISKIFGELITLIEDTKRYGSDEYLSVKLPYSGEQFVVPDNLYIIGTMNTADRSLATLDVALRRRFEFVEMMPQPNFLQTIKVSVDGKDEIDLEKWLTELNRRIQLLRGREFTIGHALFRDLKNEKKPSMETLEDIMRRKILPLLDEYFFEDWRGIRKVLGDTDGNHNAAPGPHFVKSEPDNSALLGRSGGAYYKWDFDTLKIPEAYARLYKPGGNANTNGGGKGN